MTKIKLKTTNKTFRFSKVKGYSIVHDIDSGMSTYKINTSYGQTVLKVPTASILWFREC